jgi:hypothetical protein
MWSSNSLRVTGELTRNAYSQFSFQTYRKPGTEGKVGQSVFSQALQVILTHTNVGEPLA